MRLCVDPSHIAPARFLIDASRRLDTLTMLKESNSKELACVYGTPG